MRTVEFARFGGPDVLAQTDRPRPVAGAGQVGVEIAAAEVLFLDTQQRSGWAREFFPVTLPFVPGAGVAGVVRAVGEGVDSAWVGRPVAAGTGGVGTYAGGGYAELAAVPEAETFALPDGLDPALALAALHDGPTALAQIERSSATEAKSVLVNAAAGSLGSWLVPMLAHRGVRVIAAARGERKLAHVRAMGADVAIDYSVDGWASEVMEVTSGSGVDIVFDSAGGEIGAQSFPTVRDGGQFLAYGAATGAFAPVESNRRGVRVAGLFKPDDKSWHRLTASAVEHLAAGTVRPLVGQTFPLEEASAAHTAIEARRTVGKTVLVP